MFTYSVVYRIPWITDDCIAERWEPACWVNSAVKARPYLWLAGFSEARGSLGFSLFPGCCLEDTVGEGAVNLLMGKGRLTWPPGRVYFKQLEEALYCSLLCLLQVLQSWRVFSWEHKRRAPESNVKGRAELVSGQWLLIEERLRREEGGKLVLYLQ